MPPNEGSMSVREMLARGIIPDNSKAADSKPGALSEEEYLYQLRCLVRGEKAEAMDLNDRLDSLSNLFYGAVFTEGDDLTLNYDATSFKAKKGDSGYLVQIRQNGHKTEGYALDVHGQDVKSALVEFAARHVLGYE